jgi:hypothetical protein
VYLLAGLLCGDLALVRNANAAVAAGLTVTTGEVYDDNIFFDNTQKRDFITYVIPTFSFYYAPGSQRVPDLSARLAPEAQIFAQHGSLSNFGKNTAFDVNYIYRFSPNVEFNITNTLRRGSDTKIAFSSGAIDTPFLIPTTPTMFPAAGTFVPVPFMQSITALVSSGSSISNQLVVNGAYRIAPNFTVTGLYANSISDLSTNGTEIDHTVGARFIYNWRQEHNLHAGYAATFGSDGKIIHQFDFGDDYFSSYRLLNIKLDPTLTIAGAGGISFNQVGNGPGVTGNGRIALIKLWPTAVAGISASRELTTGLGLSEAGNSSDFGASFNIRFTQRLMAGLGTDYNIFDSKDLDLKVFRAGAGVEYWPLGWISTTLKYSYRWLDSSGKKKKLDNDVNLGTFHGNEVVLGASFYFDLWPRTGISRGLIGRSLGPMGGQSLGAPPFTVQEAAPVELPPVESRPDNPQPGVSK